jgi:hypothetical protein
MRPDCPPLLKECYDLLNKAYHFSGDSSSGITTVSQKKKIPGDLAQLLHRSDNRDIQLYTRVQAQNGSFSVMGAPGSGNSFVWFRSDRESEWKTGQIKYIFQREGDDVQFAIRQSLGLRRRGKDPFNGWWDGGFEARVVSASFAPELQIVDRSYMLAHAARWEFAEGMVVVVNLSQVSLS